MVAAEPTTTIHVAGGVLVWSGLVSTANDVLMVIAIPIDVNARTLRAAEGSQERACNNEKMLFEFNKDPSSSCTYF